MTPFVSLGALFAWAELQRVEGPFSALTGWSGCQRHYVVDRDHRHIATGTLDAIFLGFRHLERRAA